MPSAPLVGSVNASGARVTGVATGGGVAAVGHTRDAIEGTRDRVVPAKESLARKVEHDVILFILIFAFLWTPPLIFAFYYHRDPSTVTLVLIIILLMSFLPSKIRGGSQLAAGMSTCVIVSMFFGLHVYYGHVGPMRKLEEGRVYSGMYAQAPSAAFHDAAQLRFVPDVTIDSSQATGLRSLETGAYTFCVAPVSDQHSTGRVEFWAIGVDCCSGNDFECDDAGDPDAHYGYVAYDVGTEDKLYSLAKYFVPNTARRDIFKKAIVKAEADSGITASSRPILVSWSKLSKDEKIDEEWSIVVWKLIQAGVVAMLATVVLTQMTGKTLHLMSMMGELDKHVNVTKHMPGDLGADVLEFVDEQTEVHQARKRQTFKNHCLMVCLLPFVTLMALVMMWSWLLNFALGYIIMTIILIFNGIMVLAMMLSKHSVVHGVGLLAITIVGTQIGRYNYFTNTYHYFAVQNRETYSNVLAEADGAEYQDAGKVLFDDGTVLGKQRAVGFMVKGVSYCAAPVLTNVTNIGGGPAPGRIDFWAIGTDCCTHSTTHPVAPGDSAPVEDFWCDGAGQDGAHGGVVLHDTADTELSHGEDELHRNYRRAVQASIDENQWAMPGDAHPIMLRWGRNLDELQWTWMTNSFGVILLTGVSSAIILSCGSVISYVGVGKKKPQNYGNEV